MSSKVSALLWAQKSAVGAGGVKQMGSWSGLGVGVGPGWAVLSCGQLSGAWAGAKASSHSLRGCLLLGVVHAGGGERTGMHTGKEL